jgi:hypothetical protein
MGKCIGYHCLDSLFKPNYGSTNEIQLRMIPSRACTTALNYSQTFLLNDAVSYLTRPAGQRNKDHAHGIVAATALIYFGLAVSGYSRLFTSQLTVY